MIFQGGALLFFYLGIPRGVIKLFRIEGENVRCREIQIGGNSFNQIRCVLGKSLLHYKNHNISAKTHNFCEEDDSAQKKGNTFAKKTRRVYTRKADNL